MCSALASPAGGVFLGSEGICVYQCLILCAKTQGGDFCGTPCVPQLAVSDMCMSHVHSLCPVPWAQIAILL